MPKPRPFLPIPTCSGTGQRCGCSELAWGEIVSHAALAGGQELDVALRMSPTILTCGTHPRSAWLSLPCYSDLSLNATLSERLSSDTRPVACLSPSCPFPVLFVWRATDPGQPDHFLGLPLPSRVSLHTCLASPKACFLIPPVGIRSTARPPSAQGPERAHEYGILDGGVCFEGSTMAL